MKRVPFNFLLSFLLASACFCFNAYAQSPRMQLFEYFDNTSIPPFGAAANAHFDSLADANAAQMTFIKYHVYWGSDNGTDPMNLQNTVQAAQRVSYYQIDWDPQVVQDGGDTSLGLFHGHGLDVAQSYIDYRALVTSPFTISVSHELNLQGDSVRTHTVITKTGTAPDTLVAQVVVIEKQIEFAAAPGISGDTVFRNVMKRMLPNDLGTDLPLMSIGDSVVLDLSWKLLNVYDVNELAVVSFVQDNATMEVLQAGYSPTIQFTEITNPTRQNTLELFPNPTSDNIYITLGNPVQNGTIILSSVTGEVIRQFNNLSGNHFLLDLSTEASGIYFLKMLDDENNLVGFRKVVKLED